MCFVKELPMSSPKKLKICAVALSIAALIAAVPAFAEMSAE
jgi:hypothetical protein